MIPERNLIGVFEPKDLEAPTVEEAIIRCGLDQPIGTAPLRELVRPGYKVLVIVDDNTRMTPADKILPFVEAELRAGGVADKDVTVLIGYGTHRAMTLAEKERKLGCFAYGPYRVLDHDADRIEEMVHLGKTDLGTEIWVNKAVSEADVVVGLGHIVPHRVAGFSGGAKIIQPAVCGVVTTGQTHWLSAKFSGKDILGKADNPVRLEMEAVAKKAGLTFIINAVQDRSGRVVHLAAGDPVLAHRSGVAFALQVFGVKIPRRGDIVITDSYPADIDMWQASKGIYSADLAVRDEGAIILATPCPEGVAGQHPEVERFGYRTYAETAELLRRGEIKDLSSAAHLVHVGEVIARCSRCYLVSPGIDAALAEKLGFTWAPTVQDALEEAFTLVGRDAVVMALRHGGELLPVLE
jgi:nickel-dependent lactate racemase